MIGRGASDHQTSMRRFYLFAVLACVQCASIGAHQIVPGALASLVDCAILVAALSSLDLRLTDRKRAAGKNHAELEQAIWAARQAQAEADHANRAKTDFLACMSHEIRTPLTSVIGFTELLLRLPDLPQQARIYGQRIDAGAAALLTVVDDILDFSKVEAGAFALEKVPFSLRALLEECVSMMQPAIAMKALSLRVELAGDLPDGVLGDASRLRQVLLNLLNNAVKFTAQGTITLSACRGGDASEDQILVSIKDTGIGIAEKDQGRLFQNFTQVDSSIRRIYGGTGLGLAICKRLVDMMGGTIHVDSRLGVGTTFSFGVPLPPVALMPGNSPRSHGGGERSLRVLLVEDVPINQELVCSILAQRKHEVDVVGDGADAIMAVQDRDYDVVLMDVQMPCVDGLTATRMIRALDHRCRSVPIIAMTANVLPEHTFDSLDAGVNDVLHKPCSAHQIFAMLKQYSEGDARVGKLDAGALDEATLAKLTALLGQAKVASLLDSLARSLSGRFTADAGSAGGRAELRRHAHASVAGCGMLGFESFARTCRHFQLAPDDDAFVGRLTDLKRDAQAVIASARRLAQTTDASAA